MSSFNLLISFDYNNNKYKIERENFNYPFKNYQYLNFKVSIIGNPIIGDSISFDKVIPIVKIFIEKGCEKIDHFNLINGEFLIVIENQKDNSIFIINDRFASIPIYYLEYNQKIFLSNSYINLRKSLKINFNINKLSLFEFLYFKRLHCEDTFDDRILFLKSGSVLSFKKHIKISQYYENKILNNNNSLFENSKLLNFHLERSIKRKINSNFLDYGLFLSGGLDTRFITAILNNLDNNKDIKYYTLGWDKNGEYDVTKVLCNIIGSKNIFMKIKDNYYELYNQQKLYISNGMHNMYSIIFLNLQEFIEPQTKVLFHGHGLDYMFQGMYVPAINYKLFGKKLFIKKLIKLSYENITKYYINNISYKVFNNKIKSIIKKKYYDMYMNEIENKINNLVSDSNSFTDDPMKSWEYIINHNLSRHYSYTDVLGIGSNLEQRKIANDNDLFNFYMSLKPEQRIDGKIIKLSLLDTNKDLANLISANTRYKISASSYEITMNNFKNKLNYLLSNNKNYLFPQGKRRTWPNEFEILKNSKYFIDKINNIGNSDCLREYLDFINFDKLNLQTKSYLETNKNNDFAQFIFLLFTLENLLKEI